MVVTRCGSYSLQNSLVTRCRSCLLQKIIRYSLQQITCYSLQKLTRYSLRNSILTRCNKSLVTRCRSCSLQKFMRHSLRQSKSINSGISFFNIICFLKPKIQICSNLFPKTKKSKLFQVNTLSVVSRTLSNATIY